MQYTGIFHLRGLIKKPGQALRVANDTAKALGLTPVKSISCVYLPGASGTSGITAVSILRESHVAISTYPETGDVYLVVTTCKASAPGVAASVFQRAGLTVLDERWV